MKILLASSIDAGSVSRLEAGHDVVKAYGADPDRLAEAVIGCEMLVFRSGVEISAAVLEAGSSLRLIVRAGSGYDNIDLAALAGKRVRLVRIAGPGAAAVAELSFTMMLALARRLRWADSEWRSGHWVKSQAAGRLLTGKTLGIVGAGNIGSRVGRMGAAWGMRVLGCTGHPTEASAASLARVGIESVSFATVMSESDFISIHVPLQDSTRNLIDAAALSMTRPGVFVVNLARGGVVDEAALLESLRSGRVAGAGLDVHEREGEGNISALAGEPNVLLTPHIGAATIDSQREIGRIIERLIDEDRGEPPSEFAVPGNFIVV